MTTRKRASRAQRELEGAIAQLNQQREGRLTASELAKQLVLQPHSKIRTVWEPSFVLGNPGPHPVRIKVESVECEDAFSGTLEPQRRAFVRSIPATLTVYGAGDTTEVILLVNG